MLRAGHNRSNNTGEFEVKTFWVIVASACAVVAVVLTVRHEFDKAFIAAALGAVSWFLNYRVQVRERLKLRDEATIREEELSADEEE